MLSIGVGAAATLGFALGFNGMDDPVEDTNAVQQDADSQSTDIDAQIDENREKLETMAAETDGEDVDYSRLGC
jgi:hypothetical protein